MLLLFSKPAVIMRKITLSGFSLSIFDGSIVVCRNYIRLDAASDKFESCL
jgi:hypothetical protein